MVRIIKLYKIFSNVLMPSLMEDSWIFLIVVSGLWDPWDLTPDFKNYCLIE